MARLRLPRSTVTRLLPGLALYGAGIGLMVQAHLGVEPWDVLTLGLGRVTGLSFGLLTNLIGVAVLLLWWPLRQRPGIGTLANVLLVGTAAEATLRLVPAPAALAARIPLFALGLLVVAVATGLYVGAGLGAGPRDGLMLGLHRRLGMPIWLGRTGVEAVVLLAGWLLGGDVGPGTLAVVLLIGPMCGITVPLLAGTQLRRPGAEDVAAAG